MAVIMQMRKRGALIVALIGIAIAAFLMMDVWGSNAPTGNTQPTVGSVEGQTITADDFAGLRAAVQEKYEYYSGYKLSNLEFSPYEIQQVNDLAWQQVVEDVLLLPEYEALGLVVTQPEWQSPILSQQPAQEVVTFYGQFLDDGTGFNPQRMASFVASVGNRSLDDPNYNQLIMADQYYRYIENDMRRRIYQQKYAELFQRSTYVPDWMANQLYDNMNRRADISYTYIPYTTIPDSTISPTDAQLNDYLKRHAKKYESDPVRSIDFVVFDAFPTPSDTAAILANLNERFADLQATDNDSLFFTRYGGPTLQRGGWDASFRFKEDITSDLADTLFVADTGTYFGPYEEEGEYRVTKLIDRQMLWDSLRMQHILIYFTQDRTREQTIALRDSVIDLYRNGESLDSLAFKFSDDPSATANLGDMGWWKPTDPYFQHFKDEAFLRHEAGDTFSIMSSNGAHFFRVTETSPERHEAVQLGFINAEIKPSKGTTDSVYNETRRFLGAATDGETFQESVSEMGLTKRVAQDLEHNAVDVPGVGVPARTIVSWAYNARLGEVKMFTNRDLGTDKFVVSVLVDKRNKGIPKLEQVREQITPLVIDEIIEQRVVDQMAAAIAGSASTSDVAAKIGYELREAAQVSFESSLLAGTGAEPQVVAVAMGLGQGQLSGPVAGNAGVFAVSPTTFVEAPAAQSMDQQKQQLQQKLSAKIGYNIVETIRNSAQVKDERYKYY